MGAEVVLRGRGSVARTPTSAAQAGPNPVAAVVVAIVTLVVEMVMTQSNALLRCLGGLLHAERTTLSVTLDFQTWTFLI